MQVRYEKGLVHKPKGGAQGYEVLGIGVAEIVLDQATKQLEAKRSDTVLFAASEPRFGSVSTMLENDYVYLYGQIPGGCQIALARVPKLLAQNAYAYERWDGSSWSTNRDTKPVPMFSDCPQGAILRSKLFGPSRPYIFVGVSKYGDSKIRVGSAPTPQGPWDVRAVAQAKGINYTKGFTYCIYPHEWAIQDGTCSLLVSWSEQFPGGVVAGKLCFQTS